MRVIKLGVISIIVFSVFLTLLSFLFPSHVRISKAIDIRTNKDSLMAQLSNQLNWHKWYPGKDTARLLYTLDEFKVITAKGVIITGVTDSTITTVNADPKSKKTKGGWNIF